ncbi:MAG: DUF6088 family protein [Phascolarctobacterium sp.]
MLYEYILKNYIPNEVILAGELKKVCGKTDAAIRRELKKLVDEGKIRRYDQGIYYLPKMTVFGVEAAPDSNTVVEKKYLKENDEYIGYISGIGLANRLGLTTQAPAVVEIVSNKASRDYREAKLGQIGIILRKPKVLVTSQNVKVLQFLDLIKDLNTFIDISITEAREKLIHYMQVSGLSFAMIKPYFKYYPAKIYQNLYEVGLMDCVYA